MKYFLLGIIATVVLIGSGFLFYKLGNNSVKPSEQMSQNTLPSLGPTAGQLVGNDKDIHGCIGSAGYSWCESKNKCLRIWEEGCPVPEDMDLIRAALDKKNNWPNDNSITVTVSTNDGKYASGTAGGQGGGGYFYAAKVDGEWKIVADGNGTIPCSAITYYPDFPKTLIPSCFDDKTNKTVAR